jgi:hypothetical protein
VPPDACVLATEITRPPDTTVPGEAGNELARTGGPGGFLLGVLLAGGGLVLVLAGRWQSTRGKHSV